jgi:hypothetical protein
VEAFQLQELEPVDLNDFAVPIEELADEGLRLRAKKAEQRAERAERKLAAACAKGASLPKRLSL